MSKKIARFIGADGSCGLKRMKIYRIEIVEDQKDKYRYRVYINNLGITYDTMAAINKNWDFLE